MWAFVVRINALMNFHNQFHDYCVVFVIVINIVVFMWLVMAAGLRSMPENNSIRRRLAQRLCANSGSVWFH